MKKHILIVEDDSKLRTKLTQLMELEGFTVSRAGNGIEAIKILDKIIPDVILSDVEMPSMNGHELLKYTLDNPELMNVPFILCSCKQSYASTNNALNFAADYFLTKPFKIIDLIRAVHKVTERNKNRTYKEIQDWVLKKYYLQ